MNERVTILTDSQRALIKEIVILFHKSYNHSSLAVKKDVMVNLLIERGHKVNERTFRQALEHIRRNDTCRKYLLKYHSVLKPAFIVSGNDGYWWTENIEDMRAFWESQHGRVCEIMSNAHTLYKLFGFDERQLEIFNKAV